MEFKVFESGGPDCAECNPDFNDAILKNPAWGLVYHKHSSDANRDCESCFIGADAAGRGKEYHWVVEVSVRKHYWSTPGHAENGCPCVYLHDSEQSSVHRFVQLGCRNIPG